ncbi:MAG TPA: hypothetical protein VNQ73_06440 [Ilumatobacter sp.]|nr:hypothetical protein [Ilumatobacter sp.]
MTPFRFRNRPDGQLTVDELADRISTFGLAASERQLEQFARRLSAAGEVPALTSIMLDREAPAIVRERAFARAAVALDQGQRQVVRVA